MITLRNRRQTKTTSPPKLQVEFRRPRPHEHMLVAMMTYAILLESGRDDAYSFANVLHGVLLDVQSSETKYVLACVDGQIAGQFKLRTSFHDLHNQSVMMIEHVYISRPFRGRGLYRQMHDYALNAAKQTGVCQLRLHVVHNNDRAARAYEKQGMQRCATLMTQDVTV